MGEKTGVDDGKGQGKACPPDVLAKMREDFALIVTDRKAEQGWTDADAEELGGYVAEAKGDPVAIEAWRIYLATEAAVIRSRGRKKTS